MFEWADDALALWLALRHDSEQSLSPSYEVRDKGQAKKAGVEPQSTIAEGRKTFFCIATRFVLHVCQYLSVMWVIEQLKVGGRR